MSRLEQALLWDGRKAVLILFTLGPEQGSQEAPQLLPVPPAAALQTYRLEAMDSLYRGRACFEYDLAFDRIPSNLESILLAWLRAALDRGADVAWFAFEGSFHFEHILTPDIANQIYAVGDEGGLRLALDDEFRVSADWTQMIEQVKGRLMSEDVSRGADARD